MTTARCIAAVFGAGALYMMNKTANAHSATAAAQQKAAEALERPETSQKGAATALQSSALAHSETVHVLRNGVNAIPRLLLSMRLGPTARICSD